MKKGRGLEGMEKGRAGIGETAPEEKKPLGIYLHIPFCVRKCLYCDFLSFPAGEEMREAYVRALLAEIGAQAPLYGGYEVETVFFGGGTPSLLEERQMDALLEKLASCFCFRPGNEEAGEGAEITVEANPGTVSFGKLRSYRRSGVNRLSIGLQSARAEELKALGRIHTWQDFLDSYGWARKAGFSNINVDLMSALPGQTIAAWADTLERVAALEPEHLSAYSLMIEEGTPFYEKYGRKGAEDASVPPLPDEEEERQMYVRTKDYLEKRGYRRYEISNYARPGYACRHNTACWKREDYAGFGLGAASLRENVRWKNTSDFFAYLKQSAREGLETPLKEEIHSLTKQEQMEEFMFLGLRMTEGISGTKFEKNFGISLKQIYGPALGKLEREGLIRREEREGDVRFRLTDRGIDVSNYALAEFLV